MNKKAISKKVAKVPVVIQLEALECGAASLCMILAYYNKWISLEQIRSDCGVSRDGTKASTILKAARNYGLEAKAIAILWMLFGLKQLFPVLFTGNLIIS